MPTDDAVVEAGAQLARLGTLRVVNDYVERFHVGAQTAPSRAELDGLLKIFHLQILRALRLRSLVDGEKIDAHVLQVDLESYRLVTHLEPTDLAQTAQVPEMILRVVDGKLADPEERGGVATYCLYQALSRRPGVAVVDDIHASGDARYLTRRDVPGAYSASQVPNIYKPCATPPTYRALLCTAVPRVASVGAALADPVIVEWRYVLSVTSNVAASFTVHDCAWIEAVASLLGSLYGSHVARRNELEKTASAPRSANRRKKR